MQIKKYFIRHAEILLRNAMDIKYKLLSAFLRREIKNIQAKIMLVLNYLFHIKESKCCTQIKAQSLKQVQICSCIYSEAVK